MIICRCGGIGRHDGFKIHWQKCRMGSSPIIGTIYRSGRIISSDRDRKMLVRVQLHDSVVYSLIGKTLKKLFVLFTI